MSAAVVLSGIGKRYGRLWAVRDLSLALAPGETLALLGHNGAGKTTLMKLVLGVLRPEAGKLSVLGEEPGDAASPTRRRVGFLPENVAFHDALTGAETLAFYARLKRRPAKECGALLERVGLQAAAQRRVATYSKGMRQRLGLAQALLGHPRLLLLDEPTSGLDPALRQSFYEIIRDLAADGAAVLLSSHLLTELEERTDRVVVMNRGRVAADGTLAQLRAQTDLPLQIRLRPAPGAGDGVAAALAGLAPRPEAAGRLRIVCRAADKMPVLQRIVTLGPMVADLEMVEAGLDEIYAALTDGAAGQEASP